MGYSFADICLSNPRRPELNMVSVSALADPAALVMGDEVLLGAVPMEDKDLLLSSCKCLLSIQPARIFHMRGLSDE